MADKLLYKKSVTGRVQGVGFRWRVENEAVRRGLKGFVRNLSDGSVHIEVEGLEEQLNAFLEWCKRGPGYSFVESLTVDSFPPLNYRDFRIEY